MRESLIVRRATVDECDPLTRLAFESKRSWGYDDGFMERCRPELVVAPFEVDRGNVFVACGADGCAAVGFYVLQPTNDGDAQLDMLFVERARRGEGLGAFLYRDAASRAQRRGARTLRVESDPFAVRFYEHLGAVEVGVATSSSTGRCLAVLELAL